MATTPEEFFVKGLMEESPPSPSVFLDLPSVPDGVSEGWLSPDEITLPNISRMLMEDDTDDKFSDHPALPHVQQPFAQILASHSFSTNNDSPLNRGNMDGANDLLQDGSANECTHDSAFSKGVDVVGAFLKGMEEAKEFVPKGNGFRSDEMENQKFRILGASKKRYNRDVHLEEVRTHKAVMMMKDQEEVRVRQKLDEMMFHGYEICIRDMQKLRITMANEAAKNNRKSGSKATKVVVDLPALLIYCAQAVSTNNHKGARGLLKQIRQHASATGDATQRLAQCFAKALEARVEGTGSLIWQWVVAQHLSAMEFLEVYRLYMAASCFMRVALSFSVMTAVDAMVGKNKLHIVDYGMDYGFQWAGLLRALASREGGPPGVKITAIGRRRLGSCPAEQIEETRCRLSKYACELGLPSFYFHAITTKWEDFCIEDLNTDIDEVLIVNDLFNFGTLMDESVFFDDPSPRDTVLKNIRKMRPDVFIQSVYNCSYGTSFLPRFRGVLFYYTALFDMFDATIPRESDTRVVLEQGLLGRYALNAIACEGVDLVDRPEKYRQWEARNRRAGMRQLPLKPGIVKVLTDKETKQHKDFLLSEDGQWLLQGWMGRILFAHSAWVAEDTICE